MHILLKHPEHPESKTMSTDNGIPRVGDTVEFAPGRFAKVKSVTWKLTSGAYTHGYITHVAVIELES